MVASGRVRILRLVLEYAVWYNANIVNASVFYSLSIGSGLVAVVVLCMKREVVGSQKRVKFSEYHHYFSHNFLVVLFVHTPLTDKQYHE